MTALTLTEADDGRIISAHPGDEVVIRLPENPTTGCRWSIERIEGPFLHEGDSFALGSDVKIGSGGVRELRFLATDAATARIQLKRWQAWEGEQSVDARFTVTIMIAR
jgi:inhibitor of cysteine peptidase